MLSKIPISPLNGGHSWIFLHIRNKNIIGVISLGLRILDLVSEPSAPFESCLAADCPISQIFYAFTLAVTSYVVAL